MNLKSPLINQFKKSSHRTAIQFKKDNSWIDISYSEFEKKLYGISSFLINNGVNRNDKIAIALENRPEWPLIFFSAIFIGAVVVPIGNEYTEKEIIYILNNSECKFVFVGDNSPLIGKHKELHLKVISCDSEEFKKAIDKPCDNSIFKEFIKIEPDDLACILYTSGTTDEPKGAMLTHKNIMSNVNSLHSFNLISEADRICSVLPLHHIYPLTVTMILPLLFGGKIIYPGSLKGDVILSAMTETNPTVFAAVPQILHMFHKRIFDEIEKKPFPIRILFISILKSLYFIRKKTGVNITKVLLKSIHDRFGKSLRFFISGGAKLDETVQRDLFKLGFTILEGYGLTETSPVLTMNSLKKQKIGSVGRTIPNVEIKIAAQDENGIGEVAAKGPNVMKGYYKREGLTKEAVKDGWFYTGDFGFIDEDGYLFLQGRLKELIVLSSGLKLNPAEIEKLYMSQAPVRDMCLVEAPSKHENEATNVLWAIVQPDLEFFRKYGEVNLRHVIKERFDNVSRSLPYHKRIMGFSITLNDLPHTLLGKVKRFEVKNIYRELLKRDLEVVRENRELKEDDREFLKKDVSIKIINYLKASLKTNFDIHPDDTLELDLGIDSLGRIELTSGLERVLNISIKDETIGSAFTVRDLIKGIEGNLKESPEGLLPEEKDIRLGPEYWKKLFSVLPRKENLARIDLNPSFGSWLGGFLFSVFLYSYFKIFHNLKTEGKENFPPKGPFILYANHVTYYDGLLVAASFPRFPRVDLFFVGFAPYFLAPIVRNLIRIGRIIPLDFSSHLLEALRSSYCVLNNNKKLFLFPEGLRSLDGRIGEFKKGFGILIKESGVNIVPVILEGAYRAWPRTSKFPKLFAPIKVTFGKVLSSWELEKEGFEMGASSAYEAICLAARKHLVALKKT